VVGQVSRHRQPLHDGEQVGREDAVAALAFAEAMLDHMYVLTAKSRGRADLHLAAGGR
jgi:hypothetical protein